MATKKDEKPKPKKEIINSEKSEIKTIETTEIKPVVVDEKKQGDDLLNFVTESTKTNENESSTNILFDTNNSNNIIPNNGDAPIISTETVQKKKGAGRPKGSTKDPNKQKTNNTQSAGLQTAQNQNPFLAEYQQVSTPNETATQAGGQNQAVKNYFTGLLILTLLDAFAPALLSAVIKRYKPEVKVNMKELRLTNDEIKGLEPLADEVVRLYIGTLDPLSSLTLSLLILYAGKAMPYVID